MRHKSAFTVLFLFFFVLPGAWAQRVLDQEVSRRTLQGVRVPVGERQLACLAGHGELYLLLTNLDLPYGIPSTYTNWSPTQRRLDSDEECFRLKELLLREAAQNGGAVVGSLTQVLRHQLYYSPETIDEDTGETIPASCRRYLYEQRSLKIPLLEPRLGTYQSQSTLFLENASLSACGH